MFALFLRFSSMLPRQVKSCDTSTTMTAHPASFANASNHNITVQLGLSWGTWLSFRLRRSFQWWRYYPGSNKNIQWYSVGRWLGSYSPPFLCMASVRALCQVGNWSLLYTSCRCSIVILSVFVIQPVARLLLIHKWSSMTGSFHMQSLLLLVIAKWTHTPWLPTEVHSTPWMRLTASTPLWLSLLLFQGTISRANVEAVTRILQHILFLERAHWMISKWGVF